MANFDGYTAHTIEKFTSLYDQDDVTNAPLGVAAVCRNSRFHLTSVRTRDGINVKWGRAAVGMDMGTGVPVTGGYYFKYEGNGVAPDKTVIMAFDQNGNLKVESPAGSGIMIPVTSSQINPPAKSYLQAAQTLNRAYLAFTNVAKPSATGTVNGVYDLNTGILDPLSMKPVGGPWMPNTVYMVGECVCSAATPTLGKMFRCTTPGKSGANEPAWNTGDGATTNDTAPLVWTENTPIFSLVVPPPDSIGTAGNIIGSFSTPFSGTSPATGFTLTTTRVPGAGGFAAGRDIYLAATLVVPPQSGVEIETNPIFGIVFQNTTANDRFQVKVATALRAWLTSLPATFAPIGWELYEADVATGAAAPALTAYKKIAGGPNALAINTTVNVDNTGTGGFPPNGGTSALVAPFPGNVPYPTGASATDTQRFMVVLFVNRNGYISGWGPVSAVKFNAAGGLAGPGPVQIPAGFNNGAQILALKIPTGPPNTAQRIAAFTQAGGSSAGPFGYIPANDSQNGIPITSTVINDNTTTSAIFNFTDTYLIQILATTANVTTYFDKILIPPCRSVTYLQTLDRMAYFAYNLPSGAYISPPRDPETVFGSNGAIQVAETDGQNLMGLIDFKGIIYGLKEESGHEVNPSSDNPAQWTYTKRWEGVGPCGLRAFDSGMHFFVFVHRSGVYFSQGDVPQRLIKEIPITWQRINWAAKSTIWVKIDEDTHEILVGVPLDGATVPNKVLSINYEEDQNLSPPVHSSVYSKGKFISSASARKWSIQDIAANSCFRTRTRTVLNPAPQMDTNTIISQLMFPSSYDSSIPAQTPGYMFDNGNLIPWVYETVCPGDALKLSRLGGAQALLKGNGSIGVTVLASSIKSSADGGVTTRQTEIKLRDAIVSPGNTTDYKCGSTGINERFRLRFSTLGKAPGTWCDLLSCTIYPNPVFTARGR